MAVTLSDSKNLQMAELKLKLQTKPPSILKILREHKSEHKTSYTPSETCIETGVKIIIGYWRVYGGVDSYCGLMIYDTVWSVRWYVDCVWNVMAHVLKPDFVSWRNGRVHLNRRGASVQSATGSRGVRIRGSNAGYTIFRGSVKSTGY